MQTEGTIEEIEAKEYNNQPYLRVKIDGKWYSAWEAIVQAINAFGCGVLVNFKTEKQGKYENIISIHRVQKTTVSVQDHNIDSYVKGCNDTIDKLIKYLEGMKK